MHCVGQAASPPAAVQPRARVRPVGPSRVRVAMTRATGGDASSGVDLQIRARAVATEVARIRRAVRAAAGASGMPGGDRDDVALAVSEACSNVVVHAYVDAAVPGPLFVDTYRRDGEFVVVVSDQGTGIAPRASSPGAGLGLPLIARLTRRLEIGSNGRGGAKVTMAFACAG
jgi:anti-sigma regulatory factor (Ser/Thr protein kinase)